MFFQIEERAVPLEELMDADEAFCTGTAMVVKPVSSVTYQGKRYIALSLYITLAMGLWNTLSYW